LFRPFFDLPLTISRNLGHALDLAVAVHPHSPESVISHNNVRQGSHDGDPLSIADQQDRTVFNAQLSLFGIEWRAQPWRIRDPNKSGGLLRRDRKGDP
jgi:hypothetical protein